MKRKNFPTDIDELAYIIYKLNWSWILYTAINARKTSWYDPAVREWRNASDEIASVLVQELRRIYDKKKTKER